jgi:flagella basal body P-ring formation protein FlgA
MSGLFLSVALSTAAFAATPVDLRDQPASHGGVITLADLFDGADAHTTIGRAATPGGETVLSASLVQTAARNAGLDWSNPKGLRRIIVASLGGAGPSPASSSHSAAASRARRSQQTLTYARNIQAGDILGAADLVWSDDAIGSSDGLGDPDAAIGKAARRALRAGAAVSAHDLLSARLVKRDDLVAVSFDSEGVTLTLEGKAMGDGAAGETIRVLNPSSKLVIEAVVSGPGQAQVGPRADLLKAQASGSASALQSASLR